MSGAEAYVTMATNDHLALGAQVLGHSLRDTGTTRSLVVIVTHHIGSVWRDRLATVYDLVHHVDTIVSGEPDCIGLKQCPTDLSITFTKLRVWTLTQYSKGVYLDADTLVLQNIDDLFAREELSAAPDIGWPDCFNAGVFVFRPSSHTFEKLSELAACAGSYDGGDQGLLNHYFSDWATKDMSRRLPFVYNLVSRAFYSYAPAMKQYGQGARVVHFIGEHKPWFFTYDYTELKVNLGSAQHQPGSEFIEAWWKIYVNRVRPTFHVHSQSGPLTWTPRYGGPSFPGPPAPPSGYTTPGPPGGTVEELDPGRRFAWERGEIDYTGVDSFEHIQRMLDKIILDTPLQGGAGGADGPEEGVEEKGAELDGKGAPGGAEGAETVSVSVKEEGLEGKGGNCEVKGK